MELGAADGDKGQNNGEARSPIPPSQLMDAKGTNSLSSPLITLDSVPSGRRGTGDGGDVILARPSVTFGGVTAVVKDALAHPGGGENEGEGVVLPCEAFFQVLSETVKRAHQSYSSIPSHVNVYECNSVFLRSLPSTPSCRAGSLDDSPEFLRILGDMSPDAIAINVPSHSHGLGGGSLVAGRGTKGDAAEAADGQIEVGVGVQGSVTVVNDAEAFHLKTVRLERDKTR